MRATPALMARSLAAGPCPGSRQSARPGRLQVGRAGRAQMSVAVARAGAEQEEPERYQNSLDSLSSSPTLSSSSSSSSYASPASGRRQLLAGALATAASVSAPGTPARAAIGSESQWPLRLALPVAPFSKKKTVRAEAGPGVWTFDQCLGIYYVTVNLRMTVIALQGGGLFVYAPVAPTEECLALLQPLIDEHGPVRFIVLPSVAVEHKVNAGPFARKFPAAEFYACDRQYSFPVPLPSLFLGLPRWTKPLPESSEDAEGLWGGELQHLVAPPRPPPPHSLPAAPKRGNPPPQRPLAPFRPLSLHPCLFRPRKHHLPKPALHLAACHLINIYVLINSIAATANPEPYNIGTTTRTIIHIAT